MTRPGVVIGALALLASLLAFNRLDVGLLVLPALLHAAWLLRLPAWRPLLVGFLPLIGWLLFSTVYFGFPFPNTAYAKLAVGIPAGELFAQGLGKVGHRREIVEAALVEGTVDLLDPVGAVDMRRQCLGEPAARQSQEARKLHLRGAACGGAAGG